MTDATPTPTPAEYRRRRALVADYLATVPAEQYAHDGFMTIVPDGWLGAHLADVVEAFEAGTYDGVHDALGEMCDDAAVVMLSRLGGLDVHPCNTVACAAGWVALGAARGEVDVPRRIACAPDDLAGWLGYSRRVYADTAPDDSPFYQRAYAGRIEPGKPITRDDVIRYLREGAA